MTDLPRRRRGPWPTVGIALSAALVALLALPVLALLLSAGPSEFVDGLRHPLAGSALRLSLITSTVSLLVAVIGGTPLAWVLARSRRGGAAWLETALQLPVVMPPAVAGVALLLAFGRRGLVGAWLADAGAPVAFTSVAVVVAQVFVAAPFYVLAATAAFRRLDEGTLLVARSLGAGPTTVFFRIAVPLARGGLVAGAALSWARALGEFGATLMFAGNLSGRTQTLPLAIYTALESNMSTARALSIVLVATAFGLLFALRRWAPLPWATR